MPFNEYRLCSVETTAWSRKSFKPDLCCTNWPTIDVAGQHA